MAIRMSIRVATLLALMMSTLDQCFAQTETCVDGDCVEATSLLQMTSLLQSRANVKIEEGLEEGDKTVFHYKQDKVSVNQLKGLFDKYDDDDDGYLNEVEITTLAVEFGPRSDVKISDYFQDDMAHLDYKSFEQLAKDVIALGPRPLCDPAITASTCAMLNHRSPETWNTSADANLSISHLFELEYILSTPSAKVKQLLEQLGVENVESDPAALNHGAYGFVCQELCEKIVASLPEDSRPPSSDVGCYQTDGGTTCDVDLSPVGESLKLPVGSKLPDGEAPPIDLPIIRIDANLNQTSLRQDSHMELLSTSSKSAFQGYDLEHMKLAIANLFAVYPPILDTSAHGISLGELDETFDVMLGGRSLPYTSARGNGKCVDLSSRKPDFCTWTNDGVVNGNLWQCQLACLNDATCTGIQWKSNNCDKLRDAQCDYSKYTQAGVWRIQSRACVYQSGIEEIRKFMPKSEKWVMESISKVNSNSANSQLTTFFKYHTSTVKTEVLRLLNSINSDMMLQTPVLDNVNDSTCASRYNAYVNHLYDFAVSETTDCPFTGDFTSWENKTFHAMKQNNGQSICTGSPVVRFCPRFFSLRGGDDLRAHIVIHELAHHQPAATLDVENDCCSLESFDTKACYGYENAKCLAQADPSGALNNADNVALFTEAVYRRRRSSKKGGCFPGDATVLTRDRGKRQLRELVRGELIATADSAANKSRFESFLGDMHSDLEHNKTDEFVKLTHEHGFLRLSASHFVKTVEKGFLPAGEVRTGDRLLIMVGKESSLKMSMVVSTSTLLDFGLYAPLTFSGNILVDGVLASSYTTDEFQKFVTPSTQDKLLSLVGYNGVNTCMHILAFPLRFSYRFGLLDLLDYSESFGLPGSKYLGRIFKPTKNIFDLKASDDLPRYVEYTGRAFGFALNSAFSFA